MGTQLDLVFSAPPSTQPCVSTRAPDPAPAPIPAPVEQLRQLDAQLAAAGPSRALQAVHHGGAVPELRWVELDGAPVDGRAELTPPAPAAGGQLHQVVRTPRSPERAG